jgi:transcriptional regulator with XRE-family HTH domain
MRSDYIGLRVARWRDLAGMTQQQLADAIGCSREYVSMIENGKRAVTKRDLLLKLALAVGVDVNDLTAQPYPPADGLELAVHAVAPRIRRALDGDDDPGEGRPLAQLGTAAETAMVARMACDYPTLGGLLPGLIAETVELAERGTDLQTRELAIGLFVKACVTGSLAVKSYGFVDLGIRLAERADIAARQLRDPVHTAAAQFAFSQALLAGGSMRRSLAMAVRAADDVQPHLGSDGGREWYGMLHLQAALVGANLRDNDDDVCGHLAEAEETAAYARGNPWRMELTPANVGCWRVAVALESGDPQRAPVLARAVDRSQLLSVQRRVRLLIDTGRGEFLSGKHDKAVRCLLEADEISAIEVRSRPAVREIVGQMVRDSRTRGGSSELRTLAARLRLDPLSGAEREVG